MRDSESKAKHTASNDTEKFEAIYVYVALKGEQGATDSADGVMSSPEGMDLPSNL